MNELEEMALQCPFCGEDITMLIDCSVSRQGYVEDCEVCCRPIELEVVIEPDGTIHVTSRRDDE